MCNRHERADDGRFQIGIGKDDIGRFAAQFLSDSLDRIRGQLRHSDARSRRTGERHHINFRMRRDGLPDCRPVPIDKIEYAARETRFMDNVRQQHGAERRNFAWLQHHGATRRQSGRDFGGHLIERPVPWRDQAAYADGFAPDNSSAHPLLELILGKHPRSFFKMEECHGRLAFGRECDWRAHFKSHQPRKFGQTCLEALNDTAKPGQALFDATSE